MFWILRKSQNAMAEYVSAYDALAQYIAKRDSVSFYLLALTKTENVVSCCYQVFEVIMKLTNAKRFAKGDGSKYERLNRCYMRIKHLESSSLDETYIQATWLDDKGFNTNDACVTYREIKEIVEEVKLIAENLSTLK